VQVLGRPAKSPKVPNDAGVIAMMTINKLETTPSLTEELRVERRGRGIRRWWYDVVQRN